MGALLSLTRRVDAPARLLISLLFLVGFGIRSLAVLLAGWCILTAAIFHTAFGDPNQLMNFFKTMTMAGAFLLIARVHPWS